MAQLTTEKYVTVEDSTTNILPTATAIYKGSFVGVNGAVVRQLVAGDVFAGIATHNQLVAGDVELIPPGLHTHIHIEVVGAVAGATNVGANVYASDGDVATLTSSSNTLIGKVIRVVSGTTTVVQI